MNTITLDNGKRIKVIPKQERLLIYKCIYDNIDSYEFNNGAGFCHMLRASARALKLKMLDMLYAPCYSATIYYLIRLYPELYKYKPKDAGIYWFPGCDTIEGLNTRKEIITKVCKELNLI